MSHKGGWIGTLDLLPLMTHEKHCRNVRLAGHVIIYCAFTVYFVSLEAFGFRTTQGGTHLADDETEVTELAKITELSGRASNQI